MENQKICWGEKINIHFYPHGISLYQNKKKKTINIDIQKVLTAPQAEIGALYYFSKICVWNCTIFDLGDYLGICHVWNETIGHRGANELSSFLWEYFEEQSQNGVEEFTVYSDSCSG